MSDCCNDSCAVEALQQRQRGTLWAVLLINGIMFFVIAIAAIYANSSSLLSDSLDNLGDTLTYILSLYAVNRGVQTKAKVAMFKGGLIFLAACIVAAEIIYKQFVPSMPVYEVMGVFSLISLLANAICLYLLWRHRAEDVNMSSVWECSRNDIAVNIAVFVTAGAVWLTSSAWPDVIVAACLVVMLMRSGLRVMASAKKEMNLAD